MYIHTYIIHIIIIDSLISQLCPMMKRCLGKEENYDLRMDTALVSSHVRSIYLSINSYLYLHVHVSIL